MMKPKILLLTPPFVQPSSPYPATAYLSGYLRRKGYEVAQSDLSIEVLCKIFSKEFLGDMFALYDHSGDDNIEQIYALRRDYLSSVDTVMRFLHGQDEAASELICMPDFLPRGSRFDTVADTAEAFGTMGRHDCAKYLSTLYLQDLSDFLRATVSEGFEIVRYDEQIAMAIAEFSTIEQELQKPCNALETVMCDLLRGKIEEFAPDYVGITVPFPGNLVAALRIGQYLKANFPSIKIIIGGGYPTTELRAMTDRTIFNYVDYVVLDDGELALERIAGGGGLIHTYSAEGYTEGDGSHISHSDRGCPDYSGLDMGLYFSLVEVLNPMHRLWSDGRHNKIMLAHGCYHHRCAFCDTSLDYIRCYDPLSATQVVDQMESIAKTTGSYCFHFVDEAAPPKLLKDVALEILRRGKRFSWWTNIRFEKAYTGDLCELLARSGCIAVSGGLEVASDRLLGVIDKGIDIEQATIAMRNFYYAGIMVHTYLMYGLPTETLQESIDALEVVRQMFRAELIGSAFWHRYAMTVHSPSGIEPEHFGVRRKDRLSNPFANNEVAFAENRGYSLDEVGDALTLSLANYLVGEGLEKPVNKWFEHKVPPTSIAPSLITDHLIKPDRCRIYDPSARIVWLGGDAALTDEGLLVRTSSEQREVKLPEEEAEFMASIMEQVGNLDETYSFGDIEEVWQKNFERPFIEFYSSKKWDQMRRMGLLQL
ncbi:MAG: cobalamin-dependent protein [Tidjanibacter sp.]|nr:cobalamin-dependent protein [Tidjanibacter sp.]